MPLIVLLLVAASCGSGSGAQNATASTRTDQDLLRELIAGEPDLSGPQFTPRIGTSADALLDNAQFLSARECGAPTPTYSAAATHFTAFSDTQGVSGSLDLWLASFEEADQATAFHQQSVQLWDSCVPRFNETNLLQVEPFAVARDLLGDGSGMGGVVARTTRVGTTRTVYTYDLPFGRVWARIRIANEEAAADPEADRQRILTALWRTLQATEQ